MRWPRSSRARGHRDADHRRARRATPACSTACPCTSFPPAGSAADRSAGSGAIARWSRAARGARLYREHRPDAVVGFGGYPALPPLLAAFAPRHPDRAPRTERGARPGQPAARRQAMRSPPRTTRSTGSSTRARSHWSATRCARASRGCATRPFPSFDDDGLFSVLVTGGSQGATSSARSSPTGSALLRASLAAGCRIVQQCRPDDIERRAARAMPSSASPPS